jgi:hypothetical protein
MDTSSALVMLCCVAATWGLDCVGPPTLAETGGGLADDGDPCTVDAFVTNCKIEHTPRRYDGPYDGCVHVQCVDCHTQPRTESSYMSREREDFYRWWLDSVCFPEYPGYDRTRFYTWKYTSTYMNRTSQCQDLACDKTTGAVTFVNNVPDGTACAFSFPYTYPELGYCKAGTCTNYFRWTNWVHYLPAG